MSKGAARESKRARAAFEFYCAENRADAVKRNDSKSFGDLSKAMAKAWRQIGPAERTRFEACAVIDRLRRELEKLRSQARKQPEKAADTVHQMANALGRAPLVARRNGVIAEALAALEEFDRRMNDDGRALVAERIEPALRSPTTAATLQRVLGDAFGQRIMALFRKWWNAAATGLVRATISALPRDAVAAASAPPIQQSAARATTLNISVDEATRQKVRALFKGTLARCDALAATRAMGIEQELFEVAGARSKEYKQRARSLNFNLNAADQVLLKRVVEGELSTKELVQLGTEELASESLKDKRREERERFFREEVSIEAPPKRRRDLFRRRSEPAAEKDVAVRESDDHVAEAEAQVPPAEAHTPATSTSNPLACGDDSDTDESDSTSDESSSEASESEQSSSDSSGSESGATEDQSPAEPHSDTEVGGFVLPLVVGGA